VLHSLYRIGDLTVVPLGRGTPGRALRRHAPGGGVFRRPGGGNYYAVPGPLRCQRELSDSNYEEIISGSIVCHPARYRSYNGYVTVIFSHVFPTGTNSYVQRATIVETGRYSESVTHHL